MSLNRIYCKKCEDFKVHDDKICKSCDTEYSDVKLVDIPREKLEIQQERFRRSRNAEMTKVLNYFLMSGRVSSSNEIKIIESDAGLLTIEKYQREKEEKQREEKIDLLEKYKSIQRNDVCLCGSNKKYKKCCETKINNLKN